MPLRGAMLMDKIYRVKCGAIVKTVPEGSLKWYLMAGWKIMEAKRESNSKKNASK